MLFFVIHRKVQICLGDLVYFQFEIISLLEKLFLIRFPEIRSGETLEVFEDLLLVLVAQIASLPFGKIRRNRLFVL